MTQIHTRTNRVWGRCLFPEGDSDADCASGELSLSDEVPIDKSALRGLPDERVLFNTFLERRLSHFNADAPMLSRHDSELLFR
eukprot:7352051-Karenia_brevis.AAC.1